MRFRQIFARRTLTLHQVRHRIQAEAIHPHVQPELHHVPHFLAHGGVVVIEIRLMAEETVPVVGFGNRVPSPVGHFGIDKDDPSPLVPRVGVAPDIPVAAGIVSRTSRLLKPRMLIRGMIQNHLNDHSDAAFVSGVKKLLEVFERPVTGMNRAVISNVIAVVAQRRREETASARWQLIAQFLQDNRAFARAPRSLRCHRHCCRKKRGRVPDR